MRTSDVCPTCATYINACCVIYDGVLLTTLDIAPLDPVCTALSKIEAWAKTVIVGNNVIPPLLTLPDVGDTTYTGKLGYVLTVVSDEAEPPTLLAEFRPGTLTKSITLTAAQIKTLGTTPIDVVAAPGEGKYIRIINADIDFIYGTTPFDANELVLKIDGAANDWGVPNNIVLNSVTSALDSFGTYTNENSFLPNAKMILTGIDSTLTGDSICNVYVTYQIVELVSTTTTTTTAV